MHYKNVSGRARSAHLCCVQIGSRSSVYSPESSVRKTGSYIYEEFMPTDGTDVKVDRSTMSRFLESWDTPLIWLGVGVGRFIQWGRTTLTPRPGSLLLWTGRWSGTVRARRSVTRSCCPPWRSWWPGRCAWLLR